MVLYWLGVVVETMKVVGEGTKLLAEARTHLRESGWECSLALDSNLEHPPPMVPGLGGKASSRVAQCKEVTCDWALKPLDQLVASDVVGCKRFG